jgi:hypothetical protein
LNKFLLVRPGRVGDFVQAFLFPGEKIKEGGDYYEVAPAVVVC